MSETVTIGGREFVVVRSQTSSHPPRLAPPKKRQPHRMLELPLDGKPVREGTLTLATVPPSVNGMFANATKGRRKTLAYRNWRAFADREIRDQPSWHVPGKIRIEIRMQPTPGDCDNRIKAALDLLVGAGRIQDDKNVVKVSAEFDATIRGTLIKIEAI